LSPTARASLQTQVLVLLVATVVIGLSVWMDASAEGVSFLGHHLPPLCTFKRLTGWDCPGCGLTRSFTFMGSMELRSAFSMHWLGPLLWLLIAAQIPLRSWRIWQIFQPAREAT
jgi:hypothetical protein